MQNKSLLITLSILSLVFLSLALVSASNLAFTFPTVAGNPGATITGIFNITNNNASSNFTLVTIQGSGITFSPSSFSLNTTQSVQYSLTIPSNQTPGAYSPSFTAVENMTNGTNITESLTISGITVNSVSSFTMPSSVSLSATGAATFTITNTGNIPLTITLSQDSGDFAVNFSQNPIIIAAGSSSSVTVQTTANPSTLTFGTHSITLSGTATGATTQKTTLSLTGGSFCTAGKAGGNNITVSTVDVTSNGGDDLTWSPLDEVKVKVEVDTAVKLSGVSVELGLYDSKGINKAGSLNFLNDGDKKIDLGTMDSTSKTRTFDFIVPADLKADSYTLLVKAYTRSNQSGNCYDTVNTGLSQGVSVQLEDTLSKYIAFDNVQLSQNTATCGNSITLNLDAVNIGDTDQSRVRVNIVNQNLGLDQSQEIVNGLNSGESQPVSFTFTLPQGILDGSYPVQISADYDYSNGAYRQIGSGLIQRMSIQVAGCAGASPTINASFASSAEVGQNLAVQISIKNPGNMTDFVVTPTGYDSWSTPVSPTSQIINVPASSSATATIVFNPTKSGPQTFTIQATYAGKTISQLFSVNVAEKPSIFSGLNSTTLYVIAAILVILIIIIFVLIIRASNRKPEF